MDNTMKTVMTGTVFPVSNIVLLPGIVTMIHLAQPNDLMMRYPESMDAVNIALPLRTNFAQRRMKEEDFYRVGVSFSITDTERTEKGVFLKIKVHDRVEVSRIIFEVDVIRAEYTDSPEKVDLDEKSKADMLGYLKNIVSDISEKFRGGEQYRKIADKFTDINAFIAYLSQFMPISAEEKYEFLKIESLKERSLRFMDCLLKQKESIELSMQINEKFSEKTNRSYREAMLR